MYAPDNTWAIFVTQASAEQMAQRWVSWKRIFTGYTVYPVYERRALKGYRVMSAYNTLTNDDVERLEAL